MRQLEALVRLSESLAKMRLEPEVQSEDVAEALRLFKVSTMAANAAEKGVTPEGASGTPRAGVGNAVMPSREEMMRTESFLRSRLAIGAVVNKQRIIEEAAGQGYNALLVSKAMSVISRGLPASTCGPPWFPEWFPLHPVVSCGLWVWFLFVVVFACGFGLWLSVCLN